MLEKQEMIRKSFNEDLANVTNTNMLNDLKNVDTSISSEIKKLIEHKCPYCSAFIEDSTEMRIIKYNKPRL